MGRSIIKQMKLGTLKHKLDSKTQAERPQGYCEVCGSPAEVYHHFIQKSQSEFLRYHIKNLIQLCSACHFKHHKGDPAIVAAIIKARGRTWYNWINEHRHILVKQDKAYQQKLEKLLKEASQ